MVIRISGTAWVRQATLRTGTPGPKWYSHPRFGPWRHLRVGEKLDPLCEVKTDAHSTVTLQTGDQIEDLSKLPSDSAAGYVTLSPNSAVRLNSQYYARHPNLEQKLYGYLKWWEAKGKMTSIERH